MTDILHADSFLGTNANFAADMTLVLSILVALIFTAGSVMALRQRYGLHRWLQTGGAVINTILVLWLMIIPYLDFVVAEFNNPIRPGSFYWISTLHAVLGLSAFLFGNFVVLRGHNLMIAPLKFNHYKPYMRAAYALYMAATLTGIWVYVTWFIVVANPPVFE